MNSLLDSLTPAELELWAKMPKRGNQMNIRIEYDVRNYLRNETMLIDGKDALSVYPLCECPEDAIIGRDLVSCQDVAKFMKQAYEAGKKGESFDIEVVKKDEK